MMGLSSNIAIVWVLDSTEKDILMEYGARVEHSRWQILDLMEGTGHDYT